MPHLRFPNLRLPALMRLFTFALTLTLAAGSSASATAATGLTTLPATGEDGPVTVYYPTDAPPQGVQRGPFHLDLSQDPPPGAGNGRLVVISHGSGGSPWVHADLARALVAAGFVVALPEHRRDNFHDHSAPGPESWKLRPREVSHAIDAVQADARLGPLVKVDRVGVYGMSAGGHTALSLAGGRWSPAAFRRHCDAHIREDFNGCVGLLAAQNGGLFDGLKRTVALWLIDARFDDDTPQAYTDARVAAVVAAVPYAADFDPASLATPRVPLGFVTAGHDRWLTPRYHSERILAACASCERVANLPDGGHGALLSPLPPGLTGLIGDLLNDPPGFDRQALPGVDRKIAAFFQCHLLDQAAHCQPAPAAPAAGS